jgi:phosphate transport system permease protein
MNPPTPLPSPSPRFEHGLRPRGEIQVWLTAAGLAVGVLMVVALLGLVFWQGITVFWPHRVVEVELREDSDFSLRGGTTIAGVITRQQAKAKAEGEEWQLFVGNKDAYGMMFHYLDEADILSQREPEDILIAERMEYGDSVFYPLALHAEDGAVVEAGEPDFLGRLREALDTVNERRDTIRRLEKKEIGKINKRMESLRLDLRTATERDEAKKMAALEARLAALQAEYDVLAAEAWALRQQQRVGTLRYRLPTGEERTQILGDLIRIHQPNTMGFGARLAFFFGEIWRFLSEEPREANTEGGIFPAIFGTFVMTVLMSAVVMPFGVLAAIYLREYAKQGPFVRGVRIAVNNLAGVPSIVFGVFGLGFFVYFVGGSLDQLFYSDKLPAATFGTGGILWASLTLALMTVPVVVVATEEALAAVPRGVREASLACGASKWQTIQRIVLPVSTPGILTGLILAMARGAGEVAPLMLVGVVKLAPSLPLDGEAPFIHLERKFMHLGFHIYDLGFQSPDSEAARPIVFATTLLLITLVVVLNLGAILLRNRLRRRYAGSTF